MAELRNITVFGAGGTNIGYHLVQALVKDGNFNVTVLARESSKTVHPSSVNVIKVADDFPHSDLVAAFKGQDAVIVATGSSGHELQYKLIDAAIEAGVKRFIPSEWGFDNADPKNNQLNPIFGSKWQMQQHLQTKESESFSWTAVATGIWLDWALDLGFLGIDTANHKVSYWANGTHRFSNTTLPYSAQAVLAILRHPEETANKRVYVSPFQASQEDIATELEKLQGVKYDLTQVDGDKIIEEAKEKISKEGDVASIYTTITGSVVMPGYGSDFQTAGKQPLIENIAGAELPKVTLKDVLAALHSSKE